MDDMFEQVNPDEVTAGEFMERLTEEALDNDGVTHLVQRMQDTNTGEEIVVVLHVGIEAVMTADQFEEAINDAEDATTEPDDPVVQ